MKVITATDGTPIVVDDVDFAKWGKYDWTMTKASRKKWQAVRRVVRNGRSQTVRLHRLIAGATSQEVVRFKNGNMQDCRRENLEKVPLAKARLNRLVQWSQGKAPVDYNERTKALEEQATQLAGRAVQGRTGTMEERPVAEPAAPAKSGYHHSEETKARQREARLRYVAKQRAEKAAGKAPETAEETLARRKAAKAMYNKMHRAKLRAAKKQTEMNDVTYEKLSTDEATRTSVATLMSDISYAYTIECHPKPTLWERIKRALRD